MEQIIIENGGTTGIANYSAVVASVRERLKTYDGLIITEAAIPQTKTEIAELRRIAKTASDLRISVKKEHEAKISETINQLKEITDLYTEAASKLDSQIKEYEDREKEAKTADIKAYWDSVIGRLRDFLPLQTVWNPKWLNKGYQMAQIQVEIDAAVETALKGMRSILSMHTPHEQTLLRVLFTTLDMQKVLDEKQTLDEQAEQMERRKEQERVPVQNPVEEDFKEYTLTFRVTATKRQLVALREFLIANNIKFVKGE